MEKEKPVQSLSPEVPVRMPALALRGLVVFPKMTLQFDVGRKKSILALANAVDGDQNIFLVTQKDMQINDPEANDLYRMGVIAKIHQVVHRTDGALQIMIVGMQRAKILNVLSETPYFSVELEPIEEKKRRLTPNAEALIRYTQSLFEEYIRNFAHAPAEIVMNIVQKKDCGELADSIAMNLAIESEKKLEILEELHPYRRLQKLSSMLKNEIDILTIEEKITEKTKKQIDESQRDYYLREQMRVIADELGEDDNPLAEADQLRERIQKAGLPEQQREKLLKECDRLSKMPDGSHEGSVITSYVETCRRLVGCSIATIMGSIRSKSASLRHWRSKN